MHAQPYPTAETALADAVRHGSTSVEVACPEADCGLPLLLIDRDAEQITAGPVGYTEQLAVADPDCPGDDLAACPGCLELLATDTVILRDRGGRCARALADEVDDRVVRGRALQHALRTGQIVTAAGLLRVA